MKNISLLFACLLCFGFNAVASESAIGKSGFKPPKGGHSKNVKKAIVENTKKQIPEEQKNSLRPKKKEKIAKSK